MVAGGTRACLCRSEQQTALGAPRCSENMGSQMLLKAAILFRRAAFWRCRSSSLLVGYAAGASFKISLMQSVSDRVRWYDGRT